MIWKFKLDSRIQNRNFRRIFFALTNFFLSLIFSSLALYFRNNWLIWIPKRYATVWGSKPFRKLSTPSIVFFSSSSSTVSRTLISKILRQLSNQLKEWRRIIIQCSWAKKFLPICVKKKIMEKKKCTKRRFFYILLFVAFLIEPCILVAY